jgi:hypothetical protein
MKVTMQRRHVVRPENYESVELVARVEVDSESETDKEYFEGSLEETAGLLSENLDILLDPDVDRTLRSDGQHIEETHLWAFYEKG